MGRAAGAAPPLTGVFSCALWDGWGTLARADERAFSIALSVLGSHVNADRGVPFTVLLRGEGPSALPPPVSIARHILDRWLAGDFS